MSVLRSTVSPVVLTLMLSGVGVPALAASFTVPPASGPQSVSGQDTGSVAVGATLNGGADAAITWSAPAIGSGILIENAGTITSTDRAIDSAEDVTGTFALVNNGQITATDDALRIRGSFTGGVLDVINSGVIHSVEGQALDLDKATDFSASISIDNIGVLSSAGSDAVRLGGGNTYIFNTGTIETTASGKRAIKLDTAATFDTLSTLTIVNGTGALISGTDDGIKLESETGSTAATLISISNSGTIRSTVDGQAIDLGGIATTNTLITINNYSTGRILAADDDAIQGANGMEIYNSGLIRSAYAAGTADTQNNSGIKIDGKDIAGGMSAYIVNLEGGVISGAYHGIKASGAEDVLQVLNYSTIEGRNGSGVNSNGTGSVINYGTITGTFDPAASFGDGDGVDFDGAGTVENYGTIAGLGSKGTKPGETKPSTSEAIAIGGGTIVNGDADVRDALITGANNGILADDSNGGDVFSALSVVNYGTIRGQDGFGIHIVNSAGTFGNTVVNYGTISGTTFAVAMGNGDDVFVYEAGSRVVGAVNAEGGFDTLRLGEVDGAFDLSLLGDAATYRGFESLTLATGSSWLARGTTFFSGVTQVEGATLLLADASLASSTVLVRSDAESGASGYLLGTGMVGTLVMNGGGVVAPGATGASGTLAVVGAATFSAGSTYQVHVGTNGTTDLIAAGGIAIVDSGAKVVLDAASTALDWGTAYTILTAASGVIGNFGSVTGGADYLFLTPVVGADATSIFLTLERNGVSFARYGTSVNQRAVASALDLYGLTATSGSSALYDTMVEQTSASSVRTALTQLAGDVHATIGSAIFSENTLVNDTLLSRARQASYAGSAGAVSALGYGGGMAYAQPAAVQAGPFHAAAQPQPTGPVLTAWAQGYGQWVDASAGALSASTSLGGALVGLDATDGGLVYGFAVGYSSSSTSSGNASADADTARIAGYAGASFDAWKVRLGADLGWSSLSTTRFVALTGEQPRADYDGMSANLFGEVGYTLALGTVALEPFGGLAWSYADLGSFTEKGAPIAGLSSGGLTMSTPYSTLGLRAGSSFAFDGGKLTPFASAGWRHAFGDVTPSEGLTFLSTGTAFTADGVPVATDSFVVTGGLDLALINGISVGLAYDGTFGDGVTSNAGRGVLAVKF